MSWVKTIQALLEWGQITGDITDQTDLVEYVASAGLNIDGGNAESFTEDLIIYADGGNA